MTGAQLRKLHALLKVVFSPSPGGWFLTTGGESDVELHLGQDKALALLAFLTALEDLGMLES